MKTNTVLFLVLAALGVAAPVALTNAQVGALFGIYTPPSACEKWYDGCNMCTTAENGSVSCTRRSCEHRGRGFCSEYSSESSAAKASQS